MGKKYMIRADLEGVTGVVSYVQVRPGDSEYDEGRQLFMVDLLALIEGLNEGGAEEIVIYDEHYYGRNIDMSQLPANVSVICGRPAYRRDWPGGIDHSFHGMILLGLHSKDGTSGGLLAHTYEHDIADLILNGVSIGEIGMEAAIAGDFGVSTQMVVADSAGVQEAEALMPGVVGVAVKEAIGESAARCYPLSWTQQAIRSAAKRLVEDPPNVKPFQFGTDVTLDVKLHDGDYLDDVRDRFHDLLIEPSTIRLSGPSATAVWGDYWQMKLDVRARLKDF